jgi:hypothetical protein
MQREAGTCKVDGFLQGRGHQASNPFAHPKTDYIFLFGSEGSAWALEFNGAALFPIKQNKIRGPLGCGGFFICPAMDPGDLMVIAVILELSMHLELLLPSFLFGNFWQCRALQLLTGLRGHASANVFWKVGGV